MTRIELTIDGMNCEHCVKRVEKALSGVEGVRAVEVELEEGRATVEADGAPLDDLVAAVDDAGYTARPA